MRVNTMQAGSGQLCKDWRLLLLLQASEPALGFTALQAALQPGSTSRRSLLSPPCDIQVGHRPWLAPFPLAHRHGWPGRTSPLQQGTSNPWSQKRGCHLCLLVPLTTTRLQRGG